MSAPRHDARSRMRGSQDASGYEPMFGPPPRHVVDEVAIDLPSPPSTNNLFITLPNRKRIKSPQYRGWIVDAGWDLVRQKPGRIDGPFTVEILIPDTTKIDVDNSTKSVLDLLVKHGVIEDDNPRLCRGGSPFASMIARRLASRSALSPPIRSRGE